MQSSSRTVPIKSEAGRRTQVLQSYVTAETNALPDGRWTVVAAEWHWLPRGVKEVENKYRAALGPKAAEVIVFDYDENDATFRIKAFAKYLRHVRGIFLNILTEMIREEDNDGDGYETEEDSSDWGDPDPEFASDYIEPLEDWKKARKAKEARESVAKTDAYPDHQEEDQFPMELRFYKYRVAWSCQEETVNLDRLVTDEDISELHLLTGAQLAKELNIRKVLIGAHEEEASNLAVCKLDNIRKYFKRFNKPYNNHVFYSEGEENVKFVIQAFIQVKARYFETTLLDNLHVSFHPGLSDYATLRDGFTVRCAVYNTMKSGYTPLKNSVIVSVINESERGQPFRDWIGFVYSSKGTMPAIALPETPSQSIAIVDPPAPLAAVPLKTANIDKWTHQVNDSDDESLSASQKSASVENTRPVKKPSLRANPEALADMNIPRVPLKGALAANLALMAATVPQNLSANTIARVIDNLTITLAPNASSTNTASSQIASDSLLDPEALEGFFNSGPGLTLIDDQGAQLDSLFPALLPVSVCNFSGNSIVAATERMQAESEASTRSFYQTMKQQAPHKKTNPFAGRLSQPDPVAPRKAKTKAPEDPHPGFVKDIKASFSDMMVDLRGFRGKLVIQAEFGRIILRRFKPIQIDHLFSSEEINYLLAKQMQSRSIPTTFFTNVLTTISPEIQYLTELKDRQEKRIWGQKLKWSITYVFTFRELLGSARVPGAPFYIEIDAETSQITVHARRVLGSIYVHGTRRQWDFKISATGFQSVQFEEKHRELAIALINSLHVPSDLKSPLLYFELDSTLQDQYTLDDLSVRRTTVYRSTDTKSQLNVTEVQSLDVNSKTNETTKFYRAIPTPPDCAPIDKLGLWYEVSISSTKADVLGHNASLKLGEEASWTVESLLEADIVESLLTPGLETLKQMDGVGYWNENGVDVRSGTGYVASPQGLGDNAPQPAPQEPYQYW